MQLGLCTFADLGLLSPQQRMLNLLEEAVQADALGLDVFALGEHHRPDYVVSAPPVALAAIAVQTKNIRLSSGVTVLSSEDPVRVMEQFSSLDLLSAGRAEIMAGRGSFIESFPLFGYSLNDYEALFSEKLELLVRLVNGGAISWKGSLTQSLSQAHIYPKPVQQPIPIWIAVGGTPQSVVRAAHHHLPMTLAIIGGQWRRFEPFARLYRESLVQAGHATADTVHTAALCINQHCYISEDAQQARDEFFPVHHEVFSRIGRERGWAPGGRADFDAGCGPEGHFLVGSPQQVLDKLSKEYEVFGNTRFLVQTSIGSLPHEKAMKSMELFATRVAPELRKLSGGNA
ncbi:MAG: LLM class flavin-dependent oxidoreductase [Bacteroidetes bacterium]|nr:LLM class flavin-dependent oxidoreductase [Bacteroidota bacterium]MBS1628562.1 LLM class flavin-dependent oxidoreductase [Bacteroidota bacterium]